MRASTKSAFERLGGRGPGGDHLEIDARRLLQRDWQSAAGRRRRPRDPGIRSRTDLWLAPDRNPLPSRTSPTPANVCRNRRPHPFRARGQPGIRRVRRPEMRSENRAPQAARAPGWPRVGSCRAALRRGSRCARRAARSSTTSRLRSALRKSNFTHIEDIHHALDACQRAPSNFPEINQRRKRHVSLCFGANGRAGGETARALIESAQTCPRRAAATGAGRKGGRSSALR